MQKALGAFSMSPAAQQLTIASTVWPAVSNMCYQPELASVTMTVLRAMLMSYGHVLCTLSDSKAQRFVVPIDSVHHCSGDLQSGMQ